MGAATTVRLAWSSVYKSYAIGTGPNFGDKMYFQRIGADGTAPEPVNVVSQPTTSYAAVNSLTVAPDGEWALGANCSGGICLIRFNPDGSHTKPNVVIAANDASANVAVVHDGTAWATAYGWDAGYFQRGASPSTPFVFAKTVPGVTQMIRDVAQLYVRPIDLGACP